MSALETTLGELAEFRNGKALSTNAYSSNGPIAVFGSNGPIARTEQSLYDRPVIVIGRVGAYCGSVYPARSKSWVTDNAIVAEPKQNVDFDYLYYTLKALDLNRTAIGSAQPLLTQSGLKVVQTRAILDIKEQRSQARPLRLLDDKIELNRKMNETLEQMARAIFKSWFIDFDPVHAKAAGKKPVGMDDATAALFPDDFEKSEVGEIPKKWTVSQIKSLASNIQYGFTTSADPNPIGPKFLRITDIQGGRCAWPSVPHCEATPSELAKYQLKNGDVVVARTGASTGENMLIIDPPEAVFASYLVRFQFPNLPLAAYVASFMRAPDYFSFVAGILGGSAQPNANAQQLSEAKLVVADEKVVSAYYAVTRPLLDLVRTNMMEADTLSSIRDLLLPRLLSGELTAKEAT